MSETNSVKLTFGYDNSDETRIYTFEEVNVDYLMSVKAKVKAINASLAAGTDDGLAAFFVSESNKHFNEIKEAKIIQTIETPINIPAPSNGGN